MTVENVVSKEIEEQIGYRVEISTDAGEVLSDYVKKTTLRARVYRGGKEVTNDIATSRFHWKRTSADATADALWNSACGRKAIPADERRRVLQRDLHLRNFGRINPLAKAEN